MAIKISANSALESLINRGLIVVQSHRRIYNPITDVTVCKIDRDGDVNEADVTSFIWGNA